MKLISSVLFGMLWLPLGGLPSAAADPLPDSLTIAIGGDMIGPYVPQSGSDLREVVAVADLFRAADIGFANQEGSIFDAATFVGSAASESGGGYPVAPAAIAVDLRAFGIGMVSKANNHATDFGTAGMEASISSLTAAGIVQAGAGPDRAAACAPTYMTSRAATVALISAATTFPPMAAALPPVTTRAGRFNRPGICAIRTRLVELVTPRRLAALRAAAGSATLPVSGEPGSLRIGDVIFRAAKTAGHLVESDPADVGTVIEAIRAARGQGAVVMFAVHAHETAGTVDPIPPANFESLLLHRANEAPSADDPTPASFAPDLFHQAIDAGADLVVRTGPHAAGGVELYQGKPIFWGMGSLIFAFGGRRAYVAPGGQRMTLPEDWFTSIVATVHFDRTRAATVAVYPVALESSTAASDGMPHLLTGAAAKAVLQRFQERSARFGTMVEVADGIATVKGSRP